jgi:MFS family permease
MSVLARQIKNSLDEARLLILVVQVLLGFQMRAPFEERFVDVSSALATCHAAALSLLLIAFVLFVAPAPYLELAFAGETSTRERTFTSLMLGIGLLPFLAALGLNTFVVVSVALSNSWAWILSTMFVLAASWWWFGVAFVKRRAAREEGIVTHRTALSDRLREVMTESRMIVPGAQALLGFQFTTVFTAAFDRLPHAIKLLHILGMTSIAAATILLIAPASFHRIAEHGEESERVVRVGSVFVIASLVPLAIGVALDVAVVALQMQLASWTAVAFPIGTLAFAACIWFLYPLLQRRRLRAHSSTARIRDTRSVRP